MYQLACTLGTGTILSVLAMSLGPDQLTIVVNNFHEGVVVAHGNQLILNIQCHYEMLLSFIFQDIIVDDRDCEAQGLLHTVVARGDIQLMVDQW